MNQGGGGHRQVDNDRTTDSDQVVQGAAKGLGVPRKGVREGFLENILFELNILKTIAFPAQPQSTREAAFLSMGPAKSTVHWPPYHPAPWRGSSLCSEAQQRQREVDSHLQTSGTPSALASGSCQPAWPGKALCQGTSCSLPWLPC